MIRYKWKHSLAGMLLFLLLLASGCGSDEEGAAGGIQLRSAAFDDGAAIPARYTCEGDGISPPLAWDRLPEGAVSLALIVDDPDAPIGTWIHWLVYDIPAESVGLPEDVNGLSSLPEGSRQGVNSWKQESYGGPCPPSNEHRYFFKLYALDSRLDLAAGADKEALLAAMEGHILDQGQLIGLYQKSQ